MREDEQGHEFQVDASDTMRALLTFVALAALIGEAVLVSSYGGGLLSGLDVVILMCVVLFGALGFGVNMWLIRKGTAVLTPERLEVRIKTANQYYAWNDIAEVRVQRLDQLWLPDRVWWKFVGVKVDREIVVLKLNRSLRFGFLPFQHGTDIVGAPLGFARMVRLHVSDPHGFANAAEQWLPGRVRYPDNNSADTA